MGVNIVQFNGNQGVMLYDADGHPMLIQNGVAIPANTPMSVVGGSDAGGTARYLKTDTGGNLRVDPTGTTTQPVSSTQLPAALSVSGNLKVALVEGGGTSIGTADQGDAGTHAERWMVGLSDGAAFISPAQEHVTAVSPHAIRVSDGSAFVTPSQEHVTAVSPHAVRLTDGTNFLSYVGGGQKSLPIDSAGNALPVADTATPGTTSGLVVMGKDTTTPALRMLNVDTQGRIVTAPAGTAAVYAGFQAGYVATSTVALYVVRATTYTEQTSNAQRSVVSASANDASAGTGLRQVLITYLDSTGAGPYTETVTLNGTTPVNTVASNICYIESMAAVSVGSGGSNAGIISLKAATAGGGATIWSIAVGDNRTFGAHHYTPTGLSTYITGISVGHNGTTASSGGTFFIRAKTGFATTAPDVQISDFIRLYGQSSTVSRLYGTAIKVTGPARIVTYVSTEASSALIFRAAVDYYDQ